MQNDDRGRRAIALALILWAAAISRAERAPDLLLRWTSSSAPVHGRAGSVVELPYELTNAGGAPAFAVILRTQTTVGPLGEPVRLQPGPAAGATVGRKVSFALVRGMREICVDVALQNRSGADAPEANLANNRICRAITVDPQSASEEPSQ